MKRLRPDGSQTKLQATSQEVSLTLTVRLPVAGLRFSREIRLRQGESVAYLTETVLNEKKADHFFHWTQHVTLGPPFLGTRHQQHRHFRHARANRRGRLRRERVAGLRTRFSLAFSSGEVGRKHRPHAPLRPAGTGIIVTVLLNPRREVQYIAALNEPQRLLMGYCLAQGLPLGGDLGGEPVARRAAVECTLPDARARVRLQPFPIPRREAFAVSPLFGAPTFSIVPAKAKSTVRYVSFLAQVPEGFGRVRRQQAGQNEVLIKGTGSRVPVRLPAAGLADFGWA